MKETPERFLQAIYTLSERDKAVKSIEVGKSLGLNRPDVFRSLKALKIFGYIDQKPYGKIILTEKGREKAEKIIKIHKALSAILSDIIGLSKDEAETTSYKIEHILSETATEKIIELIENKKFL